MALARTVWGIDLGQCALKALKLSDIDGEVQVEAFDIIEHPKILSQPDADRDQLIRNALEQFLARNDVSGSEVVVSVPGQGSLTVFVKLPPVEPKKIPDIVRFEAEQQIPFPLEQVVWRWQTFQDADSPDVELGLFAMKRQDVDNTLRHFRDVEMAVDAVQMAPLALYNFMNFDGQAAEDGATLLADVGAEQTDLVVADGSRIWNRSIQIGGNNFTEALVRTFKLSFNKAEKHKRVAASSKYARQIFQAMRPVFADLVQEIQRSIGYYSSAHREVRFKKMLGLGNGFRLPGLQKYLEQNLNIPVVRVDSYNRLGSSPEINAPVFTDNLMSFAVAYGLALQGLGYGEIVTNLLPREIARQRVWRKKTWWFVGAAAALVVAGAAPLVKAYSSAGELEPTPQLRQTRQIEARIKALKNQWRAVERRQGAGREEVAADLGMYAHRDFWPRAQEAIFRAIEQATAKRIGSISQQELASLTDQAPVQKRMFLFVEEMDTSYVPDLGELDAAEDEGEAAGFVPPTGQQRPSGSRGKKDAARGFLVRMTIRVPLNRSQAIQYVVGPLRQQLRDQFNRAQGMSAPELPSYTTLSEVVVTKGAEGQGNTTIRRTPRGGDAGPPPGVFGPTVPTPSAKREPSEGDSDLPSLTYTRYQIELKLAIQPPEGPADKR